MASISITEKDFTAVALAANEAFNRNDIDHANALDRIARKMNAALSSASTKGMRFTSHPQRWQDVPSTLPDPS